MADLTNFADRLLETAEERARETTAILRRGIVQSVTDERAVVTLAGGTVEGVALLNGHNPEVGSEVTMLQQDTELLILGRDYLPANGLGMRWTGAHIPDDQYYRGDVVASGGKLLVALVDTTAAVDTGDWAEITVSGGGDGGGPPTVHEARGSSNTNNAPIGTWATSLAIPGAVVSFDVSAGDVVFYSFSSWMSGGSAAGDCRVGVEPTGVTYTKDTSWQSAQSYLRIAPGGYDTLEMTDSLTVSETGTLTLQVRTYATTGATGPQANYVRIRAWKVNGKGDTGATGPVGPTGPQGPEGPQGPQGDTGPQGAKGDTGDTGPQGLQGPQGITGATGPTGPMGPQGIQGPIGPEGPEGPQGEVGAAAKIQGSDTYANIIAKPSPQENDLWIQSDDTAQGDPGDGWLWDGVQWINIGPIRGPQGPQGPQGVQGPLGPEGPQGPEGPIGPQGADGPQGPSGEDGVEVSEAQPSDSWIEVWVKPSDQLSGTGWDLFDAHYVRMDGATMTGVLILSSDPSDPLGAATKQYVDNGLAGKTDTGHNHAGTHPVVTVSATAPTSPQAGDLWAIP